MSNSKNSDKIYFAGTAAVILTAVLAYLMFPQFQADLNRTIGKLNMDDSKGILMFLHGHRETSAAWAAMIMAEQTLAPLLSKSAITSAAFKFFGMPLGVLICAAGIAAGLSITFSISRAVNALIKKRVKLDSIENLADRFGSAAVFAISLIPFWPSALSGYVAGLAGMKMKKYLPAAVLGQAICLILFFLPQA
ncbi:MAG TPA: VTT domain-containing protein [Clostridiaceae bacterium]|nr:VTT domain-containing protein [Clostridiaceae bacterium]